MPSYNRTIHGVYRHWWTGSYSSSLPDEYRDRYVDVVNVGGNNRGNHRAPTPYSYSYDKTECASGSRTLFYGPSWSDPGYSEFHEEGALFNPGCRASLVRIDESRVYNKVVSKLIGAINGGSGFNASVALGELKETSRIGNQLLDTTYEFAQTSRSLLRRSQGPLTSRALRQVSRLAAGMWLGYQYAIKPLISDLKSATEAISSQKGLNSPFKIRASETQTWTDLGTTANGIPYQVIRKEKLVYKAYGTFFIDSPVLASLSASGVTNPFLTAWELIPLSFVVDWFTGWGNWLDHTGQSIALNNSGHFQESALSKLVLIEDVFSCNGSQEWPGAVIYRAQERWDAKSKAARFSRRPLVEVPSPLLPKLEVPTGATQLLSAASLLRTIGLEDPHGLFKHSSRNRAARA